MNEAWRVLDKRGEQSLPIRLKNGETVYFMDGKFHKGYEPGYDSSYAQADTIIVGKDGSELSASGGDCAIASFYDHDHKIGAFIHFDVADVYTERHTELIKALTDNFPVFLSCHNVYIFVDLKPQSQTSIIEGTSPKNLRFGLEEMGNGEKLFGKDKQKWIENITSSFKKMGIDPTIIINGRGKDTYLDTKSGFLRCFDDTGELVFAKALGKRHKRESKKLLTPLKVAA